MLSNGPMRLSALAVTVAATALLAITWIKQLGAEPDQLVVQRPVVKPPEPASWATPVRQEDATPIADMLPVATLAASMVATKQRVELQASALLEESLSQSVASEMIDAARRHWEAYQVGPSDADDPLRRMEDYFFAAWPHLGELIRDKKVEVRVAPAPADHRLSHGMVTYARKDDTVLAVAFHTPHWRVSVQHRRDSFSAPLFDAICEAAAKRRPPAATANR